jgi:hypothetical protein
VRRNDELRLGLQLHQCADDRCVPLRIKVEFRLVDEDDPFTIVVEDQCGQEQEQFQLTRAQVVDRKRWRALALVENLESPITILFGLGETDGEVVVVIGVEFRTMSRKE